MMVRYRNDLYGNYMLIEIPEYMDTGQYTFRMLKRNRIPGVLSAGERMEDGKSYFYFDISGKRSLLEEYEDKEMQLEDMFYLFQQITLILEEIKNYLFCENMVVMDPKYIFKDPEDGNLYVLILPWKTEKNALHKLAEFFLEKINHRDENAVNAAYLFYKQQNQSQFSIYQFLPILEKESILKRQKNKNNIEVREKITEEYEEIQEYESIYNDKEFGYQKEEKNGREQSNHIKNIRIIIFILSVSFLIFSFLPVITIVLKISCIALSLLFFILFIILLLGKKQEPQEEEIRQDIEIDTSETIFFDTYESDEIIKLQWKEKGRKKQFELKDFPCIVGKMKEEVSLVISDISVSRVHCKFIKKDDKICIIDLNSTNGTFLNGLPLKNGEIQEIEKNDEILIGKVAVSVV